MIAQKLVPLSPRIKGNIMKKTIYPLESWRDRPCLSLAEAAAVAGKSYSWARDAVLAGHLLRIEKTLAGPTMVTSESLAACLSRRSTRPAIARRSISHLRLVVDNTRP